MLDFPAIVAIAGLACIVLATIGYFFARSNRATTSAQPQALEAVSGSDKTIKDSKQAKSGNSSSGDGEFKSPPQGHEELGEAIGPPIAQSKIDSMAVLPPKDRRKVDATEAEVVGQEKGALRGNFFEIVRPDVHRASS